jgi:uncharacterized membrane protein YgcG
VVVAAVVGLIVSLVVAAVAFSYVRSHTCRTCRGWGTVTETELVAASYTSEGRREVHFHCGKCGADHTEILSIPVLTSSSDSTSGSSDSGSSSDSGGSDGGGGADW